MGSRTRRLLRKSRSPIIHDHSLVHVRSGYQCKRASRQTCTSSFFFLAAHTIIDRRSTVFINVCMYVCMSRVSIDRHNLGDHVDVRALGAADGRVGMYIIITIITVALIVKSSNTGLVPPSAQSWTWISTDSPFDRHRSKPSVAQQTCQVY